MNIIEQIINRKWDDTLMEANTLAIYLDGIIKSDPEVAENLSHLLINLQSSEAPVEVRNTLAMAIAMAFTYTRGFESALQLFIHDHNGLTVGGKTTSEIIDNCLTSDLEQ